MFWIVTCFMYQRVFTKEWSCGDCCLSCDSSLYIGLGPLKALIRPSQWYFIISDSLFAHFYFTYLLTPRITHFTYTVAYRRLVRSPLDTFFIFWRL